jgi:hypothetical protein
MLFEATPIINAIGKHAHNKPNTAKSVLIRNLPQHAL